MPLFILDSYISKSIKRCLVLLSLILTYTSSFSQPIVWKQGDDGWILTKGIDNKTYKKFFAVGFWHIPGYKLSITPDSSIENENVFIQKTKYANIIMIDPRYMKGYMKGKVQMVTNFSAAVHNSFLNNIPGLSKGADKDYYRSQYLKRAVNDISFENVIDSSINVLTSTFSGYDIAYAPIDEIALGGVSAWCIPSSVGDKIYERIKKKQPGAIVFADISGHGRGSTYFFERRYLQSHSSLPPHPPYELLPEEFRTYMQKPLLGFSLAHDGSGVYDITNGSYSYKNYDRDALRKLWYENVKQLSDSYKNNGNVFSINAFRDFYSDPYLAATTVEALKQGTGGKAIWLYFDGNGYAKPENVTPYDYMKNVRCQIYTAIIHGATGVFFWNDWKKTPEVFDALQPVLKELNENLGTIYLKTKSGKTDGNLHMIIKESENGDTSVIASNTSLKESISFRIGDITRKLPPLGIYIGR